MAPRGSQTGQRDTRMSQDGPREAKSERPRWPQDRPREAKMAPVGSLLGEKSPKFGEILRKMQVESKKR